MQFFKKESVVSIVLTLLPHRQLPFALESCAAGCIENDTIGIATRPSLCVGGGYVGGGGIKSIRLGAILCIPKLLGSIFEAFDNVESDGLWF